MKKTEAQIIVGQAIKNKRKSKNLTQREVSKKADISRSYLSDVENGRYMPSLISLVKVATYLEMDLNFLYQMTEKQYNDERMVS